jgi:simple sugar transport system substrate-binding protein
MTIAGTAMLAAGVAACGGSSSSSSNGTTSGSTTVNVTNAASGSLSGGNDIAGKTVLWDWQSLSSNTYGVPLINGAKAAAAITGLNLDIEYGNNSDATESQQIKTAAAKGEAGFLVGVPDSGLNSALCAAAQKGPVVVMNINGATGAATKCVQSFIGQDFVKAGNLVGQYMVDNGYIKQGGNVFCPVESPGQVYANDREEGVNQIIGKLGLKCNVIGVGDPLAPAEATMVQYLLAHRNTTAIIGLGGTPMAEAEAAEKKAGLNVPIGGFDLSFPQIVSGIRDGSIKASANTEPYAQGFYGIMELALFLKYGIAPASMNTSDNALITKANIDTFASLVPQYQ